jgi:hypothetical protein
MRIEQYFVDLSWRSLTSVIFIEKNLFFFRAQRRDLLQSQRKIDCNKAVGDRDLQHWSKLAFPLQPPQLTIHPLFLQNEVIMSAVLHNISVTKDKKPIHIGQRI